MKRFLSAALAAILTLCALPACAEDEAVFALPGKADALNEGLILTKVTKVAQITGEDSENKTLSRFNVWGTDLGSMTEMDGKVYMFGGDTFSSANNDDWRSNVLFIIEDDDPSDGLTITGAITDKWGRAKELLLSRKINGSQMTVIPTDIFSVGHTLYCVYMSVMKWGAAGRWTCDYSGLAKSEDEGVTWKKLADVRWSGDGNFVQTAHCLIGDEMYLWGIPSGRFGGVALMKCDADKLENIEEYSYFTGTDDAGAPVWAKGKAHEKDAAVIIEPSVGEISVSYNRYLGNFVMTYLSESRASVVMREGVTPWGPWGKEYALASAGDYPSLYGGYLCEKYQEDGGRVFYFAMSQYFPIYNIMWLRAELPPISR